MIRSALDWIWDHRPGRRWRSLRVMILAMREEALSGQKATEDENAHLEWRLDSFMRHVEEFTGYPCDAAWGPPTLVARGSTPHTVPPPPDAEFADAPFPPPAPPILHQPGGDLPPPQIPIPIY